MPTNNSTKTTQIQSDDDEQSISRVGGSSSKASTAIKSDSGSQWAGMTTTLLKGLDPDVKKLAPGKGPQRQFRNVAGSYTGKKGSVRRVKKFSIE